MIEDGSEGPELFEAIVGEADIGVFFNRGEHAEAGEAVETKPAEVIVESDAGQVAFADPAQEIPQFLFVQRSTSTW